MVALNVSHGKLSHNIQEAKKALQIVAGLLADKGLRVIFQGTEAKTDHSTVWLPELSLLEKKNMTDEEVHKAQAYLDAVRGLVYHEVSHVLFTNREVFTNGSKEGPSVQLAMNIIEDIRVELLMGQQWRGSEAVLRLKNEWLGKKSFTPEELAKMPPRVACTLGLSLVGRLGWKHPISKGIPDDLKEALSEFDEDLAAAKVSKSTAEALEIGRRVAKKLDDLFPPDPNQPEEGEGEGEGSPAGEGEEGEPGKGKVAKGGKAGPQVDVTMDPWSLEARIGEEARAAVAQGGLQSNYLVYTTAFDRTEAVPAGSLQDYSSMMVEARGMFGVLKRNLANVLRAQAQTLTITELAEGELDSSLLYKLASGRSTDVFKEELQHLDTNLSVALLVNESLSMQEYVGSGMTRMRLAQITAALMGEVLDSLGIRFACWGHTTLDNANEVFRSASEVDQALFSRWGANHIRVYKDFGDNFSTHKSKIPAMYASCNTHDGEVLQWAGGRLLQETTNRRIVLMFDDGEPCPNRPNLVYAKDPAKMQNSNASRMQPIHERHLIEVVKQLTQQGVEVVGLGMGTSSVTRFYPRSVVVTDLPSFPVVALKELRSLLRKQQQGVRT